ncbi:MAG: DUF2752 domain-containing protein [Ruminococcus sp.]|nr:DUF2752 domain-containing protein [Ruminococcus sp.]
MERSAERLSLIKRTAAWAAVLLGYYLFTQLTGLSLPCVFYEITGLKCPGCGMTHMAVHLAHFEFREALTSNPLLFFMVPFLLILLLLKIVFLPEQLKNGSRVLNGILVSCIVLLVIFGAVRNIIGI